MSCHAISYHTIAYYIMTRVMGLLSGTGEFFFFSLFILLLFDLVLISIALACNAMPWNMVENNVYFLRGYFFSLSSLPLQHALWESKSLRKREY